MPNYSEMLIVGSKHIRVNHYFKPEQASSLLRNAGGENPMAEIARVCAEIGNVDFVVSSKKLSPTDYECDIVFDVSRNRYFKGAAHVVTWADSIERFFGGNPQGALPIPTQPIASGARVRPGMTQHQMNALGLTLNAGQLPPTPKFNGSLPLPRASAQTPPRPPTPIRHHNSHAGNLARKIGAFFGFILDWMVGLMMWPFAPRKN